MGEDVSYRSASWDDMGRAIAQISGWGGALERMRQVDRTLQQIQKAIDDLDEDRRLWFSYKSQAGALDKLGQDYRKLGTFTGEAGDAVNRQIDDPFYKQMDAFAAEMAQVSISQYHTRNTLNVKEYQAASPLASVAAYEPVTKQSITFDDLFNSSSLMAASLKKEYESYRAAAGKQAGDVTFDQYKESIQYSRGFDYQSIKDKQMDQEFWVNLGIGAAVVILTIACPPAGIAAGAAYGAMQLADAATGTSLISGRKLSAEERVTEGVFGVLDVIPAFKAAGAFSAIGRLGTKGVTTLGDLTKTMGRASGRRLIQLKQISRAGIDSVKQAAANAGDRLSLSGLQPEFAGAPGVGGAGGGESLIQNVKSTFRQMASKEGVNPQINYSKIEDVQGAEKASTTVDNILRKTKCTNSDLQVYLKSINSDLADEYLKMGKWPEKVQIPKSPEVLKPNGRIDWSQVPNDGFKLNEKGNPIKKPYIPKVGEVIDRYGPADGRFTSPVIDGKPYSYEQRSLPYLEDESKYHQYKITRDFNNIKSYIENCSNEKLKAAIEGYMSKYSLTVDDLVIEKGEIAPGFGSIGGGIQYQLPLPIKMLENLGMIEKLF
ncbi:TNT domain-containing protein [Sporolactobacillus sp. CQH2019]|uniref:TNT domain-containing protein n=1 Tax=Sporolactobacillus sp. CQH2019 TaxID=3023512 RepID=UPI002368E5DA|nr:TNT domain-containing protein [Sporolactobacillus sp. CQH2019]MDD9149860.1 TNT domain-containing protein [Sporolactobacillus sp. CQH2019]